MKCSGSVAAVLSLWPQNILLLHLPRQNSTKMKFHWCCMGSNVPLSLWCRALNFKKSWFLDLTKDKFVTDEQNLVHQVLLAIGNASRGCSLSQRARRTNKMAGTAWGPPHLSCHVIIVPGETQKALSRPSLCFARSIGSDRVTDHTVQARPDDAVLNVFPLR